LGIAGEGGLLRIAVLLPPLADLGMVWRSRALAAALTQCEPGVRVVVGLPESTYDWEKNAARLRAIQNVSVRRLTWELVESGTAARMHDVPVVGPFGVPAVNVPRDAGWSFRDCDFWVLYPNVHSGAVADVKPSLVYCRDLSDRYVPELVGRDRHDVAWARRVEAFLDWRRRDLILATTDRTIGDLSSFAGAAGRACRKVPSIWNHFRLPGLTGKGGGRGRGHLLLLCDGSPRHDLAFAAEAYFRYLQAGGTMDLVVAGPSVSGITHERSPVDAITKTLAPLGGKVLSRVHFENVTDDDDLELVCGRAAVVWSASVADSEPDALAIAAQIGASFLGCDFPALRETAASLGLYPIVYKRGDSRMIADLLIRAAESGAPVGCLPENTAVAADAWSQTVLDCARNVVR
jgi:hypothetical protein